MEVFILVFAGRFPTGSHSCDAVIRRGKQEGFPRLFQHWLTIMARQPVHEIRRGLIVVRIWQKRSRRSRGFSTSIVRLYRNGTDWKESTRFGPEDIPVVRLALDAAFGWMLANQESSCP